MIKILEDVLARVRNWPQDRQQDAARVLADMERVGTDVYRLSDEERADIAEAIEEVERGETARDSDVAEFFARFRR